MPWIDKQLRIAAMLVLTFSFDFHANRCYAHPHLPCPEFHPFPSDHPRYWNGIPGKFELLSQSNVNLCGRKHFTLAVMENNLWFNIKWARMSMSLIHKKIQSMDTITHLYVCDCSFSVCQFTSKHLMHCYTWCSSCDRHTGEMEWKASYFLQDTTMNDKKTRLKKKKVDKASAHISDFLNSCVVLTIAVVDKS